MSAQRIGTLTPLEDVERWIEANVAPAQAAKSPIGFGGVLAADLRAGRTTPAGPVAAIDGYAVKADETFGATLYTPTRLTEVAWLDEGAPLPEGLDAVMRADGVSRTGAVAEAIAVVAPGENVRPAGSDGTAGELIRPAGAAVAVAASTAAEALGASETLAAWPQLLSIHIPAQTLAEDWPSFVFGAFGCRVAVQSAEAPEILGEALYASRSDAVIVHGGTGEGENDFTVATLAEIGVLAFHGIALDPGETAAIGSVDGRPVLCLPGRPEAGLAVALTLGRALVRRLMAAAPAPQPMIRGRLTRKVVGAPGRTRLVYVDVTGEAVEPLGSSGLPLAALGRAIGYLLLPAGLEGHPEGALVDVMPLPGYPGL